MLFCTLYVSLSLSSSSYVFYAWVLCPGKNEEYIGNMIYYDDDDHDIILFTLYKPVEIREW